MFQKHNFHPKYIYEVDKSFIKQELIEEVKIIATNKFNFTKDYWERGCITRFFDFFFGDLAKKLVGLFLIQKDNTLDIIDYDDIRDDNFQYPDKFDLKVKNYEIEIKSSLEKYTNSEEIVYNKRRIIIGLYYNKTHIPDYRVQVFFIPKDVLNFWDFMQKDGCKCLNFSNHSNFIDSKIHTILDDVRIFLMGWIRKEDEIKKINSMQEKLKVFNNASQTSEREYINFFLNETRGLDELVIELQNIRKK